MAYFGKLLPWPAWAAPTRSPDLLTDDNRVEGQALAVALAFMV